MILFNVKMISGTLPSPVTDFKNYLVMNMHLCKVLIDTDAKVSVCSLYHAKLKGIDR